MIKRLLLCSSILFVFEATCQIFPHALTVSNQTYADISSGTSANILNEVWDDPNWDIPVGFDFMYSGINYNQISFGGLFGLGGEILLGAYADGEIRQSFAVYAEDLVDAGTNTKAATPLSEITYSTAGVVGSRIFKLQWKDCAFYPQADGPSVVRVDFQLWLYEASNNFEFRYGPYSNPNDEIGAGLNGLLIGIGKNVNIQTGECDTFWAFIGDEATPEVTGFPGIFELTTTSLMDLSPIDGRVYSFAQLNNVAVAELTSTNSFDIVSSLVQNNLQVIYFGNQTAILDIYSLEGSLVNSERINNGQSNINISGFSSGYYVASVKTVSGTLTKKFFVR